LRSIWQVPVAVTIDSDGHDTMTSGFEGIVNRHCGRARNLMLGRTSAEEKEDPGHAARLPCVLHDKR
jgi:hypothetical protein